MPVRTGWRSDAYSPKAGKQTAIDKFCNLRERRRTERSRQGPRTTEIFATTRLFPGFADESARRGEESGIKVAPIVARGERKAGGLGWG